jgi:hypothetical protein
MEDTVIHGSFRVARTLALGTIVSCGLLVAAQSAKADDFIIHDTVEGTPISISTNGDPTRIGSAGGCSITGGVEIPFCWSILPPNHNFSDSTRVSIANIGLSEANAPAGTLSDELSFLNVPSQPSTVVQFQFASEINGVTATPTPLPNCQTTPSGPGIPCVAETGTPGPVVASWTWQSGVQDTLSIESDAESTPTVPEPASLILFGSGLAIAGGFLRRRRRLVTPPVAA